MKHVTIQDYRPEDIKWYFEDGPQICLGDGGYGRRFKIDPFPCYAHDRKVLVDTLEWITAVAPPPGKLIVYRGFVEELGRTNAFQCGDHHYDHEKRAYASMTNLIWLNGKRTPIHPAITRFVIRHEYAHALVAWLAWVRRVQHDNDYGDHRVLQEYAEMRGIKDNHHHSSGPNWHSAVAEVAACDFRIAVAQVEFEHWPHEGISRPGAEVSQWWSRAMEEIREGWSNGTGTEAVLNAATNGAS